MITFDGQIFRINPSIRTSPLVEGKYRLYFADRPTSFKINGLEWDAIVSADAQNANGAKLFADCNDFFDHSRTFSTPKDYIHWLSNAGIITVVETQSLSDSTVNEGKDRGVLGPNSLTKSDKAKDSGLKRGQDNDRKIFLVSFNWLTSRGILQPPRLLIRLQAWLFPLTAIIFCGLIYNFYFGTKPLSALLAGRSDPLTGLSRLLIMLIVINFISVMVSIILSYSLGITNQNLYLRLKWGFLPRLAKEQNVQELRATSTKLEELVLIAQPLLVRLYLIIIGILSVYLYTPVPDTSPYSRLNVTVAIIQGALASMIILLIPVRNTPGRRLLEFFGVMPRNYLQISFKRTSNNFSLVLKGRASEIALSRADINSFLFLVALAIAFTIKIFIVYNILIPNISTEIPQFAGHWTSLIVRVALSILLIRFLYLTFFTKLIADRLSSRSARPLEYANQTPYSLGSSDELVSPQLEDSPKSAFHSLHVGITSFFKAKFFLSFILIVIFLFPFRASITGSANVTEGETLDIRSPESALVSQIYQQGPSSVILNKGTRILNLSSESLISERNQQRQQIAQSKSEIRSLQTKIRSIETGSIQLEGQNRDEELISALAMVDKTKATIDSLETQVKVKSDQVSRLRELAAKGAISEFQLQNLMSSYAALLGELSAAKSELKSQQADVSVAKRSVVIDQQVNAEEELMTAKDQLAAAESSLLSAQIALQNLDSRLNRLEFSMPFNGVISSDTKSLLGRAVTPGETVVTVKAQPLTKTIVLIPEYDRARIDIGLPCILRLYSISNDELSGQVKSISPITVEIDGLQYVELQIELNKSLPTNFIGSKGYAKIKVGYTCILLNLLAPIARFINVDLWSLMP